MTQAVFQLTIGGINVTAKVTPFLLSLKVSDKVGTHSDTASIDLDDKNSQLALPRSGDPVIVMLGWQGQGIREVFSGTVDEVKAKRDRSGGQTITVSAKGFDTKSKAKHHQQRHFDKKTVKDVLQAAGQTAGINDVRVDGELAGIELPYVDMRDESFINLGERLGRDVGGNFRIQGRKATLSKRGGGYTSEIIAVAPGNLQSWTMTPAMGRPQFSKTKGRWYDRKKAKHMIETEDTSLDAPAEHVHRFHHGGKDRAKDKAKSDKATSRRDRAEGSVVIEGNTEAIPDGLCILVGARPGIDGPYRIESVDHEYSRSGWNTTLSLKAAD